MTEPIESSNIETNFVWLYVPTSGREEAKRIGKTLLDERAVACVNIFDNVTSMYWWQGAIQEDAETVLVAKTRAELFANVKDRIVALHGYDCPCVVALPIQSGHQPFLDWIAAETHPMVGE